MDVLEFVLGRFGFMPPWVRNFTYLVLLLVVVYLILGPRLIVGQIVAETERGGFVPYRGVGIQMQVQGHILRFNSNEFGYWVVPVVNRLPSTLKLQVFHEDDNSWFPVEIDFLDIWLYEFRVVMANEPPFVKVEVVYRWPWRSVGLKALAALGQSFVRPAVAGIILREAPPALPTAELPPPPSSSPLPRVPATSPGTPTDPPIMPGEAELPPPPSSSPLPRVPATSPGTPDEAAPRTAERTEAASEVPQPILKSIREIVAKVKYVDVSTITPNLPFNITGNLNYIQRIQVIEGVEHRYDVKILDQHWRSFGTIEDIAEYVYDWNRLEQEFPAVKQVKNPNDWYEIQQKLPAEVKPVFVPKK